MLRKCHRISVKIERAQEVCVTSSLRRAFAVSTHHVWVVNNPSPSKDGSEAYYTDSQTAWFKSSLFAGILFHILQYGVSL